MNKLTLDFFLYGLLLGTGPCLVSCGPLFVSYLGATGMGVKKSLWAYAVFSFSRIAVYCALGVIVFFLGSYLAGMHLAYVNRVVYLFGGLYIAGTGLCMFLGKGKRHTQNSRTLVLFGVIIGLLPCAPFLAVISYIGLVSKSVFQSFWFSFVFGIGSFISPLLLLAAASGSFTRLLAKTGERNTRYKKIARFFTMICGVVIIFLGIQLCLRGFER